MLSHHCRVQRRENVRKKRTLANNTVQFDLQSQRTDLHQSTWLVSSPFHATPRDALDIDSYGCKMLAEEIGSGVP